MGLTDLKEEEETTLVKNIVYSLPPLNRNIILYVINFLRCEVLKFEENKMNFYNMSIVLNPCFFRPENPCLQDMLNSGRFASILNILFHKYDEIINEEENRGSKGDKRGSRGSRGSKDHSSSLKPLSTNFWDFLIFYIVSFQYCWGRFLFLPKFIRFNKDSFSSLQCCSLRSL